MLLWPVHVSGLQPPLPARIPKLILTHVTFCPHKTLLSSYMLTCIYVCLIGAALF